MKKRPIKPLLDALGRCEKDERRTSAHTRRLTHEKSASSALLSILPFRHRSSVVDHGAAVAEMATLYVKPGGVSKTFVQMTWIACVRLAALWKR